MNPVDFLCPTCARPFTSVGEGATVRVLTCEVGHGWHVHRVFDGWLWYPAAALTVPRHRDEPAEYTPPNHQYHSRCYTRLMRPARPQATQRCVICGSPSRATLCPTCVTHGFRSDASGAVVLDGVTVLEGAAA